MTTSVCDFRVFIGPTHRPASDASHYDWSVLNAGATTPNFTNYVALSDSDLVDESTTLAVEGDMSSWPAKAGLWIGPKGTGQAWEYCLYTDRSYNSGFGVTFFTIIREPAKDREHNGLHSANAPVRLWWPVTTDNGELRVIFKMDKTLSATSWVGELAGVKVPQGALRNDHLVVVQRRFTKAGAWQIYLVGFLDTPQISDDGRKRGTWKLRFTSSAGLVEKQGVRGVRLGNLDIAQFGEGRSAAPVMNPYKELASGDYKSIYLDFSAQSALDGSMETIWMTDAMVGTAYPPVSRTGPTQLFLNAHPQRGGGRKWIEVVGWGSASSYLAVWDPVANQEYLLDFDDITVGSTEYVIICEDGERFVSDNPAQQALAIIDVHDIEVAYANWFTHVNPAGGVLTIKDGSNYYPSLSIAWGDTTRPTGWYTSPEWSSVPLVAAPGYSQTIRYLHNTSAWSVGSAQSPGYLIKADGDDTWIHVVLPSLSLYLRDDVTPGTGTIYLIDDQGKPSTNGLPTSGSIFLFDEIASYTGKTTSALTGCSIANSHLAGTQVAFYDSVSGKITLAMPVQKVGWKRRVGGIFPTSFDWYFSPIPARDPTRGNHEIDYFWTQAVTGHSADSYELSFSPPRRIQTVLLEVKAMSVDPARPRLNRLFAEIDSSQYESGLFMAAGSTASQAIERVLMNGSLPDGAVSVGVTPEIAGLTTADDKAWRVVVSLAEMSSCRVTVARDSKISVIADPFWLAASFSPSITWTRANARSVEHILTRGAGVSQVRLSWSDPLGNTGGVVYYPNVPDWQGAVQDVGPLVFLDTIAATAAATKRYLLQRFPYRLLLEADYSQVDIQAGEIHRLQWQLDTEMQPTDRLYMVMSVETMHSGGRVSTHLELLEIDREHA